MSAGRLLLLVIVLGGGYYLYRHSGSFAGQTPDASSSAPLDRARRAAQQSDRRSSEADAVGREAESPAGTVTENMTPDQVRALLGPPTEVQTATSESGASRETWIYRHVGKTVVFENGIAVSVR
jgi:hypothetical protein